MDDRAFFMARRRKKELPKLGVTDVSGIKLVTRQCKFKACKKTFRTMKKSPQLVCSVNCTSATQKEIEAFQAAQKEKYKEAYFDRLTKDSGDSPNDLFEAQRSDILTVEEDEP